MRERETPSFISKCLNESGVCMAGSLSAREPMLHCGVTGMRAACRASSQCMPTVSPTPSSSICATVRWVRSPRRFLELAGEGERQYDEEEEEGETV